MALLLSLAPATTFLLLAASTGAQTLFDFHDLVAIDGTTVDAAGFKGNVSLIINVASF